MKKIILKLIMISFLYSSLFAESDGGIFIELGHGLAMKPYESKFEGVGMFHVDSLNIEPEDFSKAFQNDGDNYLMVGFETMGNSGIGLMVGLRFHERESVKYEIDFSARVTKELNKDWSFFVGGGFGAGEMDLAFKRIIFVGGDSIVYPDSMDYLTAYCQAGIEYKITKNFSVLAIWELKELSVDGSELKDQVNWGNTNPMHSISASQMVSSYEATTNTLNIALKYRF